MECHWKAALKNLYKYYLKMFYWKICKSHDTSLAMKFGYK